VFRCHKRYLLEYDREVNFEKGTGGLADWVSMMGL
jgi:hypothetical protein